MDRFFAFYVSNRLQKVGGMNRLMLLGEVSWLLKNMKYIQEKCWATNHNLQLEYLPSSGEKCKILHKQSFLSTRVVLYNVVIMYVL